jgi:hypothetical protein
MTKINAYKENPGGDRAGEKYALDSKNDCGEKYPDQNRG